MQTINYDAEWLAARLLRSAKRTAPVLAGVDPGPEGADSPPLLRLRLAPHALGPMAPQARAGLSRIVGTRGARAASFCPMGMPTSGRPHFRRAARRAPLEQCPRQESSRPRRDVLGAGRWGNRRHRCAGDGRAGRRAAASMAGRLKKKLDFLGTSQRGEVPMFPLWHQIRGSIVVSISACHAEDPGSIPGRGVFHAGHVACKALQADDMPAATNCFALGFRTCDHTMRYGKVHRRAGNGGRAFLAT